ncbi:MAG: hypothetical protein AB1942_03435 [Pseudomonadota bacterium]
MDAVFDAAMVFSEDSGAGLFVVPATSAGFTRRVDEQMGSILAAIAAAQATVAALSESERGALRVNFDAAISRGIVETAELYRRRITGRDASLDLSRIRAAAEAHRESLAGSPAGLGPEGAVVLTLALAVEFGAAWRLESSLHQKRAPLDHYDQWARRMRTANPGSILFRLGSAEAAHDGQLRTVAETHLGRRLGLSNFLLAGDQKSSTTFDPCVLLGRSGLDNDRRVIVATPEHSRAIILDNAGTPNILIRFSDIQRYTDEKLGVHFISYRPGGVAKNIPAPRDDNGLSIANKYCYVGKALTVLSSEQANAVADRLEGVKEDAAARARIIAAVRNANAARAAIVACGRAMALLSEVDRVISYHRRIVTP